MKLEGYIGDDPKSLNLQLFVDADFASDLETRKSTSGLFLALVGPRSFFPLTAISKKQTAVSPDTALRTLGLPAMDLREKNFVTDGWTNELTDGWTDVSVEIVI